MANKISGLDSRPIGVSGGSPAARVRDTSSGRTQPESAATADVRITDAARRLATLEGIIDAIPEVNAARVADVSRAIDQGTFQVQADRIAQKLLRQDFELAANQRSSDNPGAD